MNTGKAEFPADIPGLGEIAVLGLTFFGGTIMQELERQILAYDPSSAQSSYL